MLGSQEGGLSGFFRLFLLKCLELSFSFIYSQSLYLLTYYFYTVNVSIKLDPPKNRKPPDFSDGLFFHAAEIIPFCKTFS